MRACVFVTLHHIMEQRNGALLALAVGLYALNSVGTALKLTAWMAVWYFTGGGRSFYLFRNTIVRDYRQALANLTMNLYYTAKLLFENIIGFS